MRERAAFLWARIGTWIRRHQRRSIGLAVVLVMTCVGTGYVISQIPPPRGQDCGQFDSDPYSRDPAAQAASMQVLSCFWHAYQHCQPATMVIDSFGTDTGWEESVTVERTSAGCDVYSHDENNNNGKSSQDTIRCGSMTQQGETLHLSQCNTPQHSFDIAPATLNYGDCGQVGFGIDLPSAPAEQCFADAYAHCAPAQLEYAPLTGDHSFRQFSIQATCVIAYTHASYQATCLSVAVQADGLHFAGCGTEGDVLVPALAPPATPTPTSTPGHYPGH